MRDLHTDVRFRNDEVKKELCSLHYKVSSEIEKMVIT